jgi:competence protein ComEC
MLWQFSGGFLVAVTLVFQLPVLPDGAWLLLLLPLLLLLLIWQRLVLAGLTAGLAWTVFQVPILLPPSMPESLIGVDQDVVLRVVGLPRAGERRQRFVAELEEADSRLPKRVLLSWYAPSPDLHPGDVWRLRIRLKPPRSFANPASFDYAGWLFQQGVGATGYVRQWGGQALLDQRGEWLNRWREALAQSIEVYPGEHGQRALIKALALGIRDDLTADQWRVLTRTGTSHLLAISGLHIGLAGGMGVLLALGLWHLFPGLGLVLPRQSAAAALSLIPALVYAGLAGFAVPTQRALIMLCVFSLGLLLRRKFNPWFGYSLALLLVLLVDVRAVMAVGFWFSFAAVAVIFVLLQRRSFSKWGFFFALQAVIFVGLLPFTAQFFANAAVISPLANLLAVPVVSFVIVPLVLLAILLIGLDAPFAMAVLQLADFCLEQLFRWLAMLSNLSWAAMDFSISTGAAFAAALLIVVLLLLPRGIPGRWLAAICVLPVVAVKPNVLADREFKLQVFDVGQGLAALVRTRQHVMLFDTGARFSERSSAAQTVIIPYLKREGIGAIDALVVSHSDNDHAGGVPAIYSAFSVGATYASVLEPLMGDDAVACSAGDRWVWDGVDFEFLHPPGDWKGSENNRSCVLSISNGQARVLFTGDIEAEAEAQLISTQPEKLLASVLIAPHHGSKTSSTETFIQAVAPEWVVYPVGWRNRWRFPHDEVDRRYEQADVQRLRTDLDGMLSFTFALQADPVVERYAARRQHWWHR